MPIAWDYDDDVPALRNLWQLIRCPRKGRLNAMVISTYCEAVWTHYYGGRTQPCRGEDCQMCREQGTRRRHIYVGIWHPESNDRNLLEITDRAGKIFLDRRKDKASSRGHRISIERTGPKANSPVLLTFGENIGAKYVIPPEPDIRACLRVIWHMTNDPDAYTDAEKTSFVRGHHRKKGDENGASAAKPNGDLRSKLPGRPGSINRLHEPERENGHLPPSSSSEPALD